MCMSVCHKLRKEQNEQTYPGWKDVRWLWQDPGMLRLAPPRRMLGVSIGRKDLVDCVGADGGSSRAGKIDRLTRSPVLESPCEERVTLGGRNERQPPSQKGMSAQVELIATTKSDRKALCLLLSPDRAGRGDLGPSLQRCRWILARTCAVLCYCESCGEKRGNSRSMQKKKKKA